MSNTVTKPPRDRTFAALGVVAGLAGGLLLYQGVTQARQASAEPSHTANVTLDAAPMPDPVKATAYDDVAGVPDPFAEEPAAVGELVPPLVARQPVEAGSGDGTAAPVAPAPAAEPLELAREPDLNEIKHRLSDLLKKYEAYKAATDVTVKRVVIFGALSLGVKLLIDLLLLLMPVLGARWKKRIPYIALGAGVLTGALTKLAAGETTLVAIVYGAGPPLAIFLNELVKAARKKAATGQPALVPR